MNPEPSCFPDATHQVSSYLESIRDFLGPFCQQGLDESNRMLRAIYQDETQESRKK